MSVSDLTQTIVDDSKETLTNGIAEERIERGRVGNTTFSLLS